MVTFQGLETNPGARQSLLRLTRRVRVRTSPAERSFFTSTARAQMPMGVSCLTV